VIRLARVTGRVTLLKSARRKRLVCVISFLGCFWLAGGFSFDGAIMLTPDQRATWIATLEADRRNGKSESISFERDNDYCCVQTARTATALDLLRNESIPVLSVEVRGEDIRIRIQTDHYRLGAIVRALSYRAPVELTDERRAELAAQLQKGRESQGQNRRGGPETAPDMADTAAADSGASGALQ
jgi:hypothetical protein